MCVAYITQSLDKGTTGAASIMGWPQDLKMKGQDYALTSTFLWVGIIIGEPIVNQFIRKFPVAKVLGISMVIWSALVLGLAFSWHPIPVFVIRALLGLFESSFGPCLVTSECGERALGSNAHASHRTVVHGRGADIDHYVLAGNVRVCGYRLELDGLWVLPRSRRQSQRMAILHPLYLHNLVHRFQ